ncbi:hypothetical protein [Oceaniovalibus sp. ACAM 378]|uniref:hypothetical protein n=1 Tax=Oceaniovalibus sp. ACAM 378 TaxID=2599923 RepID=UPI0011D32305|nr:hypothetical protein [Oceaniovalibus sp. ACAM 378]TYB85230.1 hypothetical protein FQ320_20035 [Oceaniovalibus sp. ACAM 378]
MNPLNEEQQVHAFLSLVQDCNAIVSDIGTKSFQRQIANTRTFSVVSPVSGRSVPLHANYVLPRAGVIYYFRDETDFCLLSSCLHKGHPITAAVIAGKVLPFAKPDLRNKTLEDLALKILADPPSDIRPVTDRDRSRLILGDPNFAHFLWNEFPTLDEVSHSGAAVDVTVLFDPFGITGRADTPAGWTSEDRIEALRGWHPQPVFMGTSHFCPAAARSRLLNLIGCSPDPASGPPRIYLSLRPSGRTLEHQEAFLIRLITEFRSRYPGVTFVLDGFSFPQDFHRPLYQSHRRSFEKRAADVAKNVQTIIAALPSPYNDITDITGLKLVEALKVIAGCHYYVTHSGTHQHKIAWLFNRPGFMHGNTHETKPVSTRWIARQVGDTQSPATPAAENIDDLDVQDMPRDVPRNKRYRFRDMPLVCQNILDDFARQTEV